MPRRPKIRPDEPGRDRVLQAASELFAENGFEATSITEIGREAGMSKSVLYHYFGSKRELYATLLETESERLLERVGEAVPADPNAPRLRAGLDAFLSFLAERPATWGLVLRGPPADPELKSLHARLDRERSAALTELLAQADKRRQRSEHVELVAIAVSAYVTWWHEHPDFPQEAVVDAIMNIAAGPVGSGPDA